MVNFGEFFRKAEACGQTVLPGRSILKGQKLVENAKIEKLKCDRHFGYFSNTVPKVDFIVGILILRRRLERASKNHFSPAEKGIADMR